VSDLAHVDTTRSGTTQLVRITGELDLSNARSLTDALAHALPDDVTLVVVDLTGTTYVDSAAIASLFRLSQRLRDRRQDLRLVVPPVTPIRAVVELTRLSQVIPVDESAPDLPVDPMAYAALPPPGAPTSPSPVAPSPAAKTTTTTETTPGGPDAEPDPDAAVDEAHRSR
jgi:anti-anti-sigma factor